MKNKIAVAGSILLDIVKQIDSWPERGMLVNISRTSRAAGGCVCNTGVDLKRLDNALDVAVFGKVGKDEYGAYVSDFMKSEGLQTDGIVRSDRLPTSFTDVMSLSGGERTFFHARGANAEFSRDSVDVKKLDCDLFHLGYLLLLDGLDRQDSQYGTQAARLLHDVQAQGIQTSIDLVSDQTARFGQVVTPALKFCDHAVINEVEGGMLTGISPRGKNGMPVIDGLRRICRKILDLGVRRTAVIHCPELSCAMTADGAFAVLPSLRLPESYIVGSVGAGDAFCAGMLYSFVKGYGTEDGMRLASCAAASNLAAADSVSGAKDYSATMRLEEKFGRRKLEGC